MSSVALAGDTSPLEMSFPAAKPLPIDMTAIAQGMRGPQGIQGEPGEPGNAVDLPDLTLIFENALTGPL